jgi:ribosome biogenesis GTPase A
LLDSPGIIPARQLDQRSALFLAICNDIGEASYDRVTVAAAMCDELNHLHRHNHQYVDMGLISKRYGIPFHEMSGEDILYHFADKSYQGNLISAADKLLSDFRKGMMGFGSLQSPLDALKLPKALRKVSLVDEESLPAVHMKPRVSTPADFLDIGKGNYEGW